MKSDDLVTDFSYMMHFEIKLDYFSLIYHAVQLVSNDVIDEMSLSMLSKKNIM